MAEEAGGDDCDDDDPTVNPGWALPDPAGLLDAPLVADTVDGVDNDCDGLVDDGPFSVGFDADVQPIFDASCAMSQCHFAPAGPEGLALSEGAAYDDLVDVPSVQSPLVRIAPFDPLGSYVWHKVNDSQVDVGGYGSSMPFDQPLLSVEERLVLYVWILEGARE